MAVALRAELERNIQASLASDDEDDFLVGVFLDLLQESVDLVEPRKQHGGSRPGRATNLSRDRAQGHDRIWKDYFSATPVYGDKLFRHRYRIRKSLFLSIMDRVVAHDAYFVQRKDAAGVFSLSSIQKCTAALRILAYGIAADAIDEYCRLGESTAMETVCCHRQSMFPIYILETTYS
jgi:hypothetical protein